MANLRIPGPTPCPPEVLEAVGGAMIDHRGPEFSELQDRITNGLRPFFATKSDILIISASGTGAMEAAVVNTLSPGDRVLAVSVGSFGDRFARIAEAYGADVTRLTCEWGQVVTPDSVEQAFDEGDFKAVLLTHNETSTGVTTPLERICAAVRARSEALILVDAVSSLGCVPVAMDAWGIDVLVTASQKGWQSPPGIAMGAISARGWQAYEEATMPRFYFDLGTHRDYAGRGQPPWTPALPAMYGMDVALKQMHEEGPEALYARHARWASWTRSAVRALGLEPFADEAFASNTVTAVKVPEGVDGPALKKRLRERYDTLIAGGQGPLATKIFRIGHMGWVEEEQLLAAIKALQQALVDEGFGAASDASIPSFAVPAAGNA